MPILPTPAVMNVVDFYKDIDEDVESMFDKNAYSKDAAWPHLINKNKKVVGLMKNELGGKSRPSLLSNLCLQEC